MKKACVDIREVNGTPPPRWQQKPISSFILHLREKPKQPEVQLFSQNATGVK